MLADVTALHNAIIAADRAGCPYAYLFRGIDPRETVKFLTIHFECQAEACLQLECQAEACLQPEDIPL